jgi:Flp pilus assembly secretin CpaC
MFAAAMCPPLPAARNSRKSSLAAVLFLCLISSKGAYGEGVTSADSSGLQRATGSLTLLVGEAEVVRYPREPGTVIIGDPRIATASLATSDIVVLTGLEAGETNLIVLDDSGAQIDRVNLRIVDRGETVVMRRGVERVVLRCHPLCVSTGAEGAGESDAAPSRTIQGAGAADSAGPSEAAGG